MHLEEFVAKLCEILLKERCRLLHLICAMKEDPEGTKEQFPHLQFQKWLLSLQEALICSLGDKHDIPNLSPLLERLNPSTLSPILSEALSDANGKATLTQSLITLGLSLDGSGLSKVLGLSPFAPIPLEESNRMSMSGMTASGPSALVDAVSSIHSKEKIQNSEDELYQMDLEKITGRSDQPPSKRRTMESETFSSKTINYL